MEISLRVEVDEGPLRNASKSACLGDQGLGSKVIDRTIRRST